MSQPSKILVVDDNRVDRELARMMLEKNGLDVVELSSAISCLETIAAEKPSLVLLDIMMPDLDGNRALCMIRGKYSELQLPVIMVTSKSDASDVLESLKLGANDYIAKPIQFDVAVRRIQTHLAIGLQSSLVVRSKELEAIHAMIVNLNLELNGPLAAAIGRMTMLRRKYGEEPGFKEVEEMIWKVIEVVGKTTTLLDKSPFDFDEFVRQAQ